MVPIDPSTGCRDVGCGRSFLAGNARPGKDLVGRTYAAADDYDRWYGYRYHQDSVMPASLVETWTVMYTPYLTITARQLNLGVGFHVHGLSVDIQRVLNPENAPDFDPPVDEVCHTELVIIDEADRLKTTGLI